MYARMVIGTVAPDRLDEAIRLWQTEVLPSARQQPGFRGVRLLVDRAAGRIVSQALWESEAHFQATVEWNAGRVARFAHLFTAPPDVGGYEVIADASV